MNSRIRYGLLLLPLVVLTGCISLPSLTDQDPSQDSDAERMAAREDYQRNQEMLNGTLTGRYHGQAPQARRPQKAMTPYEEALSLTQTKLFDVCADKLNSFYFRKTPCLASDITRQHLHIKGHPTAKERQEAARIFKELNALNDRMLEFMAQSDDSALVEKARLSQRSVQPQIQALQTQFVKGKVSWAQYNRRRLELFQSTH